MPGSWIAVASADHVAAGVRAGCFACSHGQGEAAARPKRDHRFAYYAPRQRTGVGAPVQALVALGHILDDEPEPRGLRSGFHSTVRRAAYDVVATAPVRPLLPRLGFLRAKGSHWGMAFRRGPFAIGPGDLAVIEAALREAHHA